MAADDGALCEVTKAEIGAEFRNCPACDYSDGFHNMFRPSDEDGVLDWYFICPSCSMAFDVGLKVRTG